MRICYDGGSEKTAPYFVEINARADARRATAEIEANLYWDFGDCPHRVSFVSEIYRQRSADSVFSGLLGLFRRAGFFPTEREADELHELIANACRVVKAA